MIMCLKCRHMSKICCSSIIEQKIKLFWHNFYTKCITINITYTLPTNTGQLLKYLASIGKLTLPHKRIRRNTGNLATESRNAVRRRSKKLLLSCKSSTTMCVTVWSTESPAIKAWSSMSYVVYIRTVFGDNLKQNTTACYILQYYTWEIKPILHGCRSDCSTSGQLQGTHRTHTQIVKVDIQAICWAPLHVA